MSTVAEFDFSVDLLKVMLWGQNQAKELEGLITSKELWYRTQQTQFWESWYRDVFNIDTANRFGLNVWAIILNIDLSIALDPSAPGKPTFGFGESNQNFGHGNFTATTSTTVTLTDDQARLLIKLRYLQLIARPTVPYVNRILRQAFGDRGNVHVLDTYDMSYAIYVFDFEPGSQVRFILENFDVLPRPSGVGIQYLVTARAVFGFGDTNQNFRDSNFIDKPVG